MGLYVEFGLTAANINTSLDGAALQPAAIALVQKIGIQRFETANNLTVDAAQVNPKGKGTRRQVRAPK